MTKLLGGHDIFQESLDGDAICVPTNGDVNSQGSAVMGKGMALTVKRLFPGIDIRLGQYLKAYGNRAFNLGKWNINGKTIIIFSFPTKYSWKEQSDTTLICKSAEQIVEMTEKFKPARVLIPKVGCGCGGLNWNQIEVWLNIIFTDSKFVALV